MRIPRLINDKLRIFAIKSLIFNMLMIFIVLFTIKMISTLNEKRRSVGREVLDDLQEKRNWLLEKMESPLHDADDIENQIIQIKNLIKAKDKTFISNHNLYPITNKKIETLKVECDEIIDELSSVKNHLSTLSVEGTNMAPHLRNLARSQTITEIKAVYDNTENAYIRLDHICNRRFISSKALYNKINECNEIIKQIQTYKIDKPQWKQFEQIHENYIVWGKNVSEQLDRYNYLEKKIQDIHQKLKSLPLDREEIEEITQKQINDERDEIESLVENGTNLCNNSLTQLEEEMEKMQSKTQMVIDLISKLQDLHGSYVNVAIVTTIIQKFESLKEFHKNSCRNVETQCISILKNIEKLNFSLNNTSASFNILLNMDNSISDKLILKKYQESQERIHKLQSLKEELEKELITLRDYITQVKSSTNETVNEIKTLAMNIQQSFPDWTSEGRKISNELTDILHDARRIRSKCERLTHECFECQNNKNQRLLKSLQERREAIFGLLTQIEKQYISKQNCSKGKELIELKNKRDEMKRMYEIAIQKEYEFSAELNKLLDDGALRKVKYIPYSKFLSIASQLQEGIRHFNFSLNIPAQGNHKIVIKLKKGEQSLYYSRTDRRKHQIHVECVITGIKNENVIIWDGTDSQNPWKKEIELEGDFPQGKIDINLGLTFIAKVGKRMLVNNGIWIFRYDKPNSRDKEDNFAIEVFLDDIPTEILVRQ